MKKLKMLPEDNREVNAHLQSIICRKNSSYVYEIQGTWGPSRICYVSKQYSSLLCVKAFNGFENIILKHLDLKGNKI